MSKHLRAVLCVFAVVNLSVATAGFMAWTAKQVLPPDPPKIHAFRNCAEYFYDHKNNFHWLASSKGREFVSFRATDMECGE